MSWWVWALLAWGIALPFLAIGGGRYIAGPRSPTRQPSPALCSGATKGTTMGHADATNRTTADPQGHGTRQQGPPLPG